MSKELTPLENFEYFIRCFAIDSNEELGTIKKLYSGTIKVIESALKRLELLESNQIFIERAKKLKALEIIENELQLKVISQLEGNEIKRYIQYLPYFAKEIDFETFELLKEILK